MSPEAVETCQSVLGTAPGVMGARDGERAELGDGLSSDVRASRPRSTRSWRKDDDESATTRISSARPISRVASCAAAAAWRPVLRRSPPAVQRGACRRRRTSRPGSRSRRRPLRTALAVARAGQPLPPPCGRVCYHPCGSGCNHRRSRRGVSIHAVERLLGDRARARRAGRCALDAPPTENASSSSARDRAGSRPRSICTASATTSDPRCGARRGQDDDGGDPCVSPPAPRARGGDRARIEQMGVRIVLDHKVTDIPRGEAAGGFDAVFVAIGAHIGKKTAIPSRDAGKIRRDLVPRRRGEGDARGSAGVSRSTAVATRRWTRHASRRLGHEPHHLPPRSRHMPHAASEARRGDRGGREGPLASHHQVDRGDVVHGRGDGDRREREKPAATGSLRRSGRRARSSPSGQDADTGFLRLVPGIEVASDGVVKVRPDL